MFNKFIRDESGIALGLAVIMIVLIGVMGAGLLVFVRNDLEAVIEVNQGQKAFDIADSGVQVARQHIAGDKEPTHYDLENGTTCDTGTDGVLQPWSPGAAVTRNFASGQFTVTIQWLNQDPAADTSCVAPKTTTSPSAGVDYFRVISTGTYGNAKRKVEAIYDTYDLNVPEAYYTPSDVTISGSACIERVSIFSGSSITFNGSGKCKDDLGNNIGHLKGDDLAYGNWDEPPFNTTPRPVAKAGVGAVGTITSSPSLGTRDYSSSTCPKFVRNLSDFSACSPPEKITFPFNVENQPDANRLCDVAKEKNNYIPDSSSGNATLSNWPVGSTKDTVVCYEFTSSGSHTLTWAVDGSDPLPPPYDNGNYTGCKAPVRQGTLVLKNGNFKISPNTALFAGVVVVRGATDTSELGGAALTGNVCLDGFVNSTGPVTISGAVTPAVTATTVDRPGFYGVRQWSWRELYQ